MKLKYGRNKYQAKNLLTEKPNEPKIVAVLLYNAERNWSYGLDLKSYKSQIKNEENRRRKFHIRKKFKKAIFYAS
jgi:signal recognition particle subunit SRP68